MELAKRFKSGGLDLLSVSIGFTIPDAKIPWGPGFMAPIAGRIREDVGIPVTSAWGFEVPAVAEQAAAEERLDLVSVGRALLANPHWPYAAAKALGADRAAWVLPAPYARWLERYSLGQF
jgi:2,4-dienoyl-CoA reductase-like NADH-dependent reductase (Old Yellow Enzyme family)